jgi:hypothetical protein
MAPWLLCAGTVAKKPLVTGASLRRVCLAIASVERELWVRPACVGVAQPAIESDDRRVRWMVDGSHGSSAVSSGPRHAAHLHCEAEMASPV